MDNSKFVISLDFELHWGIFDVLGDEYNDNILGVREAIPEILKLFNKYSISATWATVGFLFNRNYDDYLKYKPSLTPSYDDKTLSPYLVKIGENENKDKFHYANSLISLINTTPNQEIASHSYCHYYCNENSQTIKEFSEDIKQAQKIANDFFSIQLKSFIFPRNEVNLEYLEILENNNFTNFRGNPKQKIYNQGEKISFLERVLRYLDCYFNIFGHQTFLPNKVNGLYNIQGSRFLRPFSKNIFFNKLMLTRIKSDMLYAAKNNEYYHLWWHPHNFGTNMTSNLDNLEELLNYFKKLKLKYGMESVCMKNIK